MSISEEKVFCFSAKVLDSLDPLCGFTDDYKKYLDAIMSSPLTFIERSLAEDDPNWKQIIPYQVLFSFAEGKYFFYRRGSNGNEDRLKKRRSLGIGGHINDGDDRRVNRLTYSVGKQRELYEELEINQHADHTTIGVIYDPTDKVGAVHFGICHLIKIERPEVEVIDDALTEYGWGSLSDLKEERSDFERWSQLVIDHLTTSEEGYPKDV